MLTAFLVLASIADSVPMRWASADPASLDLLKGTPINCLLVEKEHWSAGFRAAASSNGIATLAVVRPSPDAIGDAQKAVAMRFDAIVLEGEFDGKIRATLSDGKVTE